MNTGYNLAGLQTVLLKHRELKHLSVSLIHSAVMFNSRKRVYVTFLKK